MKKSVCFLNFFIVSFFITIMSVNGAALDCDAMDAIYCVPQVTQLSSTPLAYEEVSGYTPSPCCAYKCISTATHETIGGVFNCYCRTNRYLHGNDCTACPTGYTSPVGSTAESDCTKSCTDIPISNGVSKPKSPSVSAPNDCEYDPVCNPGYHPEDKKCVGNDYTIKFDVNDGTPMNDVTCTYGAICNWQNTTVKNGYLFINWIVPSNTVTLNESTTSSSLPATFAFPPSHNQKITLIASWNSCPPDVGAEARAPGSCTIIKCKFGYSLNSIYNRCVECQTPGMYCDGTDANGQPCPKGWYCPDYEECIHGGDDPVDYRTGKCKCPPGATTGDIYSESISDCIYAGGNKAMCGEGGENCTKFRDSRGTFYLPSNVWY